MSFHVIILSPPEANRETDVQCPNIVPVFGWDVQHLSWVEGEFSVLGVAEEGKLCQIRSFTVNLKASMPSMHAYIKCLLFKMGEREMYICTCTSHVLCHRTRIEAKDFILM